MTMTDSISADTDSVAISILARCDRGIVSVGLNAEEFVTDTMPLSHRAKMLMATESVSALMLSVIVIARGVSLLK